MNAEISKLVDHRLDRANESIREADLLLEAGYANAGVNRLFYACFYAVSALLLTKGHSSPKHSGVRALFHQKIVKPGLVEVAMGHLYDRLFDSRQKSDYVDLVKFDLADVKPWVAEVKAFVGKIEGLITVERQA
ncbi:MAG: HEPN domain-containing protein [Truepera sp.]|nr:HEPN domain-containing protein [Truepera sp.]MBS3968055.1 HEPN domain-containing protein [Truepera sp.]MBS3968312.1 HEPN domain-containing protein [Truepera sp.]